jgi:hypothetical protein
MLRENIDAIAQTSATDLRKPRQEIVVGEVGIIIRRATQCVAQLDEWASDETVPLQDWQQNWSAAVLKRPKGVVFVISCVLIIPNICLHHRLLNVWLFQTLELPYPSQLSAIDGRHSRRMPCSAQTIRD